MATKVLQAMATSAAVDSPITLSSDSMMKNGRQRPRLLVSWIWIFFHDSFGSVLGNE